MAGEDILFLPFCLFMWTSFFCWNAHDLFLWLAWWFCLVFLDVLFSKLCTMVKVMQSAFLSLDQRRPWKPKKYIHTEEKSHMQTKQHFKLDRGQNLADERILMLWVWTNYQLLLRFCTGPSISILKADKKAFHKY